MANPALNTNISRAADSLVRVRFEIQETAAVAITSAYELRYSYKGGAYTLISAASTAPVYTALSAMFADNDPTTNVLPSGTGAFTAGVGSEDGTSPSIALNASGHTELEFVVRLGIDFTSGGPLTPGDTIDLRVYRAGGTPLNTYSFTPRITVA